MSADENKNMIPDTWDARIELILKIAVAALVVMSEGRWLGDAAVVWMTRAVGMIVVISVVMGWNVGRAAAVGIMALGLLALSATACNPYAVAWRTTGAIQAAGNLTDRAIAISATKARDDCRQKPATYALCMRDARPIQALTYWRQIARPAVNASLIATVTSMQIAERAKAKALDWLAILRPAACALAKMVEQFGHLLGPQKSAVLVAVGIVKGVACE